MTTSEAILKWLGENQNLVKVSVISQKAGIDKGNFSKFRKRGSIPEKHLIPIMNAISPMGFTLDECIRENNKPEMKKKIENGRSGVNEDVAAEISRLEEEISHLGTNSIGKQRKVFLEGKIMELKNNKL